MIVSAATYWKYIVNYIAYGCTISAIHQNLGYTHSNRRQSPDGEIYITFPHAHLKSTGGRVKYELTFIQDTLP